ncbi:thiol peroxidase [Sulfurovum sp.]|uniref:thiol peroxidase n=1 Tax=Sulfurovum sp. TaxID=1969726 RepID=UPI0028682166|nr:thiol peroxidase [Sulfurovum sp.]
MKKIFVLVLLTSALWSATVTFKGDEVTLNSNGLKVGMKAPVFTVVDKDFQEVNVGGKKKKVQVIAFIPSFDSAVCRMETIAFNQKISKMKNVVVTMISKDLPFAIGRFCHDNNIKNVVTLSDYKDANNVLRYGSTISSPPFLEGFFSRVVYVVDTNGKVVYSEVVQEITNEPDYDKVIHTVNRLSK